MTKPAGFRQLAGRRNLEYKVRAEKYQDEDYIVVPVIALVETVIWASNGEHPELVTAEAFSTAVAAWNGRPIFSGHPKDGDSYVSGNSPRLLEEKAIGIVFNAKVKDKMLLMEAWINVARAKEIEPDLLDRIDAGDDEIQVSVGAFVEAAEESGTFDGMSYEGVWVRLTQDHLAILPKGQIGACSVEAGCGIRAAQAGDRMSETKRSGWVSRTLAAIMRVMQSPDEMSDNDIRRKLSEALQAVDPRAYWPEAFYPEKGIVIYSVYDGSKVTCYRRNYSLGTEGAVTLSGDPVEVEFVGSYEDVGGSDEDVTAAAAHQNAGTGAPCSCQKPSEAPITASSGDPMTRDALKLALPTASDAQLESIAAVFTPAAPAAEAVAAAPVADPAALAAKPAQPTFEQLMAAAPADVREGIAASMRAASARKTETIAALKASNKLPASYTDQRLNGMSQTELDEVAALAGVQFGATSAAVDYSGQGVAVTRSLAGQEAGVAPAPDFTAALRAAVEARDKR